MANPVLLLINDIHVSKDNVPEFIKNWNEALEICKANKIKDIVIGGDLWQSRSAQTLSVLMAVRQALIKASLAGMGVIIAEGNHCKVDQESLLGYSHIFSEYHNVFVISDYHVFDLGRNVFFYVMSYFPENGSFTERFEKMLDDKFNESATNLLYIHEGIRGGLATSTDKELPAAMFKDFDKVFVGHYHDRKKIPGTKIEYIGASRQHNFGEDEEKGYTIVFNDGSSKLVKNQVNMRYRVLDLSINQLDNVPEQKEGYKTKTRIHCTSSEAVKIDKTKLTELGYKVEVISEDVCTKAEDKALDEKFDKSGLKAEYLQFCSDKDIQDVEMGLFYLDKIN